MRCDPLDDSRMRVQHRRNVVHLQPDLHQLEHLSFDRRPRRLRRSPAGSALLWLATPALWSRPRGKEIGNARLM
jgi:hypothetical protein